MNTSITQEREQFLADIITTAIEGGTGYWAAVTRYKWDGLPPAEVHADVIETEALDEGWAKHPEGGGALAAYVREHRKRIDVELVAKGIGRIVRGEVGVRSDLLEDVRRADRTNDAGEIDADGADVIVQAGLFGEVVYG